MSSTASEGSRALATGTMCCLNPGPVAVGLCVLRKQKQSHQLSTFSMP